MEALITACGRPDLLHQTISSLYEKQEYKFLLTIHEDWLTKIGQHSSIQTFLHKITLPEKYYLHCEDDWLFENSYDWIYESIKIMEADPKVIKVLCNSDSPHPCDYNKFTADISRDNVATYKRAFGYLEPWENKGIFWGGFSWNPGVTRVDLLKKFMPFPRWEQELAAEIHGVGYKVARLKDGVCTHIGQNRSTHE